MVCNELNNSMSLQQETEFYIPLESSCCLFVACCHKFLNRKSCDGFVLPVDNFKNLLFGLLIMDRSFQNWPYLSSTSLSQRWRFRRLCSNVYRNIESNLVYTKVSGVASQNILWSGSLWHPLSSILLEKKRSFLLEISKLMCPFSLSLAQLGVSKNMID